jgi:NAD(P)-dependent dehydrogenase (short-subunit alcohol dehydrogenase family)
MGAEIAGYLCPLARIESHDEAPESAILFLASDEASFMTGTCVFVDGGQTGL